MSETISKIKLGGTTYAIDDQSKAGLEEVNNLIELTTENKTSIFSMNTKLDELLSKVEGSGLDTSDATALASQILLGKTAYVNGVKVIGTLDLSNLLPENLVSGVVINGVEGIHICSSDSTSTSIKDLLGLEKEIADFDESDIGTIISIPYNDESGKIVLNENGCIEFEVVAVNHHKDVNDESKPTITLMTKNVIRLSAFDGYESNNPDSNRAESGNNRWSVSNIRQWLNSEGAANEWFTKQHNYDEAPNVNNVFYDNLGAYANDPGFLTGFNTEIKQHFATVKNKTILSNSDKSVLSKDFEETEDKVFLPSYTELGFGNKDSNNPEGSHLAQRFSDLDSRIKTGCSEYYWTRTPTPNYSGYVYYVIDGDYDTDEACCGSYGIAPIIVLC